MRGEQDDLLRTFAAWNLADHIGGPDGRQLARSRLEPQSDLFIGAQSASEQIRVRIRERERRNSRRVERIVERTRM